VIAQWARRWAGPDNQEVGLEAATLERVRNSSLVELACTDNPTGLKLSTEALGVLFEDAVGERSIADEAAAEACRGGDPSANAGMSNDSGGENPPHRKPEGSAARALRGGVGGPKPRARAVGDGQAVDNPLPHNLRLDRSEYAGRHAPHRDERCSSW
jgi:hypothetical protein